MAENLLKISSNTMCFDVILLCQVSIKHNFWPAVGYCSFIEYYYIIKQWIVLMVHADWLVKL